MTHPLTILTGASQGMGLAMAEQLLAAGHELLCISRKKNESLAARGRNAGGRFAQWSQDLSWPETAATRLENWLSGLMAHDYASITLINNACLLPRVAPLSAIPAAELAGALRVDLEAPMLLTSVFLRATRSWRIPRKVLNISSGLGRRPMASQAAYCAAKAGMDLFSRCVALEEAARENGAKVCSLAPGVIDTDMQVALRSADAGKFPDVATFIALKDMRALSSPAAAATSVLAFLASPDFGASPQADIRG
jgi:NAD(P)-dependent dehydrogenase (short-subunit alcohol dehydrogenase family)